RRGARIGHRRRARRARDPAEDRRAARDGARRVRAAPRPHRGTKAMSVAILGCGYVGLALGRSLAPDRRVVGVRRSADGRAAIERAGFEAVEADVTSQEDLAAVPDVDTVVFAASSGGRGADAAREIYVDGLRTTIETFGAREGSPDRLVYTSSTGVYGDHDGDWVDEGTP